MTPKSSGIGALLGSLIRPSKDIRQYLTPETALILQLAGLRGEVLFGDLKTSRAVLRKDTVVLTLGRGVRGHEIRRQVESLAIRVLCRAADAWLQQRVRELNSKHFGFSPNSIKFRKQRRRWGSCSAKGSINISHRLIVAPQELLDYVIIHELAHLAEMNHGKRFWALVRAACPDYRERRRMLAEYGLKLAQAGGRPVDLHPFVTRSV